MCTISAFRYKETKPIISNFKQLSFGCLCGNTIESDFPFPYFLSDQIEEFLIRFC